jgi:hypothetical protein
MNRILAICLLSFLTHALYAQTTGIPLERLPDLTQSWGSVEYKKIQLEYMYALRADKKLPQCNDPYYADFCKKLFDKQNLSIFTDTVYTTDQRFQIGSPFFQTLPQLLILYTEAGNFSEAVQTDELLLEMMLQSSLLIEEMLLTMEPEEKINFKQSIISDRGFYNSLYGMFNILSLQPGEDDVEYSYVIALAKWANENTKKLWHWLHDLEQQDCLAQIRGIINTTKSEEVSSEMKSLLHKLELN